MDTRAREIRAEDINPRFNWGRALPALGFEGVSRVHVGRMVELDIEDESKLPEICKQLLTNPLIEDYEVQDA